MTTLGQFTTICRREGNIPEIRIPVDPKLIQETIERWSQIEQNYLTQYPNGTPFVVACEFGHIDNVRAAISATLAARRDVTAMVNFEGRNANGYTWTPLKIAAQYEHTPIVEILLQYNANVAITDQDERNALHYAAAYNTTNTSTVQLLLENMKLEDINHKDIENHTPLDDCYEWNRSSIREELIDLIELKGGKRQWELDFESAEGTVREKYKKVFPEGTPLVVASSFGRVEDVKAMIKATREAGMDVKAMLSNVGTSSGGGSFTPLMVAAYHKNSTVIEELLKNGADTATTNHYGENALHYAVIIIQDNNPTELTTVQLLLKNMKEEDINQIDKDGDTPLDSCYNNNESPLREELIKLIRQKGGKRASELLKRPIKSDGASNKRKKTALYITLSNLKF